MVNVPREVGRESESERRVVNYYCGMREIVDREWNDDDGRRGLGNIMNHQHSAYSPQQHHHHSTIFLLPPAV
jgi:hypothetical protein